MDRNIDIRGVKRGFCMVPGCDCLQYLRPKNDDDVICHYCTHHPPKHQRMDPAGPSSRILSVEIIPSESTTSSSPIPPDTANPDSSILHQNFIVTHVNEHNSPNAASTTHESSPNITGPPIVNSPVVSASSTPTRRSNRCKKGQKIPTVKATGCKIVTKRKLDLPTLPKKVVDELNKGDVHEVWSQLIDACATFYVNDIGHGSVYGRIASQMLEKYPRIAFEGKAPSVGVHTIQDQTEAFRTALSGKIRRMRRSLDAAQTIENRSSFPNGITIIYNERPKRSLDFYDADTDTGNKSKELMQQEMNSTRDMSKLKRYIVDTYHLRTVLLQRQNKTAIDLLDEYPLLLYSTYLEVEAQNFFGEENFNTLKRNVAAFMEAVATAEDTSDSQKAFTLVQSRTLTNCKIFYFLYNSEDFSSTCALPHRDFPKLVLWYDLEEKEEKNVAVCYNGKSIAGIKSLQEGIVMLMAFYLVFEVDFPPKYFKLMNLLECLLLGVSTENTNQAIKTYISKLTNIINKEQ